MVQRYNQYVIVIQEIIQNSDYVVGHLQSLLQGWEFNANNVSGRSRDLVVVWR